MDYHNNFIIGTYFTVYYDMDDAKDYVTINIRLTKGNYNRMWEIKVSTKLRYYIPSLQQIFKSSFEYR